jgi:hypothetical protein
MRERPSERVRNGTVAVEQNAAKEWLICWEPNEGHEDWPDRTVDPQNGDYPSHLKDDPAALLAWGVQRWKDR